MNPSTPQGPERRAHVRVRPAQDYDVGIALSTDGLVWVSLPTVDVSLGGVGVLVTEDVTGRRTGDRVRLRITLPSGSFDIEGLVRHVGQSICGIQFVELPDDHAAALRVAVAELLERGNVA